MNRRAGLSGALDMRTGIAWLAVVAGLLLASCATQGRVHDRVASEVFRSGVTTPAEALAVMGPADVDVHRPDGGRVLVWKYRRLTGLVVREYTVSARFDAAGRMIDVHNPVDGQVIDPF